MSAGVGIVDHVGLIPVLGQDADGAGQVVDDDTKNPTELFVKCATLVRWHVEA
ncbi:MAG: hypothetical protein WAW88_14345 [Nocardioides sp.]